MLSRPSTRLALLALAIALALGVVLYPTDEKRVKEAAEALASAANAGPRELAKALDTYAAPSVTLNVTELAEPLQGRAAIVEARQEVSELEQALRLRLENVEVTIDGKRARLNADLVTQLRAEVPELRRPRHSVALFEKRGGQFVLVSAEIGAERRDQPEARP